MTQATTKSKLDDFRILIYSHDSFGLGHLRRCRTIAHALVDAYKGVSVLILSGSPIIGQFDFRARVDFVRIPGVIKLRNGDYTSLGLHISLSDTLALRESIILHTAQVFSPDVFLVDKEPGGLKGEVISTLKMLKDANTTCILGLRDVMDSPALLKQEWKRKDVLPILRDLYDRIWIYGPARMSNPIEGALEAPTETLAAIENKSLHTGYLHRDLPNNSDTTELEIPEGDFLLVTPGGGGDGVAMVEGVIRAYENNTQRIPALLVLGPFMPLNVRDDLLQRVAKLQQVDVITFTPNFEQLVKSARAVVAMGGYNTFCELLSFNKPALIIPRTTPREEQLIRAQKANELGLFGILHPEKLNDVSAVQAALDQLLLRHPPAQDQSHELLTGLDTIIEQLGQVASSRQRLPVHSEHST